MRLNRTDCTWIAAIAALLCWAVADISAQPQVNPYPPSSKLIPSSAGASGATGAQGPTGAAGATGAAGPAILTRCDASASATAPTCPGAPVPTSLTNLQMTLVIQTQTSGAPATLTVAALTTKNLYFGGSATSAINVIPVGTYQAYYDGTQFQVMAAGALPAGNVGDLETKATSTTFGSITPGAGVATALAAAVSGASGFQGTLTGTGLARNTGVSTELSGDATTSGSNAVTVTKINGTSLSGLATGPLCNTTTTGVLTACPTIGGGSIALAGAIPSNTAIQISDNPLTSGATTVNVNTTTGLQSSGIILIQPSTSGAEYVSYTGTTATSLTGVTRGMYGTTAASHALNTNCIAVVSMITHSTTDFPDMAVLHWLGTGAGKIIMGNPATSAASVSSSNVQEIIGQFLNFIGTNFFLNGGVYSSLSGIDTYLRTASGRTLNIGDNQAQAINLNTGGGATTIGGTASTNLAGKFGCTHGTNATCGVATLSSGTVTVSTTAITTLSTGTTGSFVNLVEQTCSGTCTGVTVGTVTNATSFVINGNSLDNSNVFWQIGTMN